MRAASRRAPEGSAAADSHRAPARSSARGGCRPRGRAARSATRPSSVRAALGIPTARSRRPAIRAPGSGAPARTRPREPASRIDATLGPSARRAQKSTSSQRPFAPQRAWWGPPLASSSGHTGESATHWAWCWPYVVVRWHSSPHCTTRHSASIRHARYSKGSTSEPLQSPCAHCASSAAAARGSSRASLVPARSGVPAPHPATTTTAESASTRARSACTCAVPSTMPASVRGDLTRRACAAPRGPQGRPLARPRRPSPFADRCH